MILLVVHLEEKNDEKLLRRFLEEIQVGEEIFPLKKIRSVKKMQVFKDPWKTDTKELIHFLDISSEEKRSENLQGRLPQDLVLVNIQNTQPPLKYLDSILETHQALASSRLWSFIAGLDIKHNNFHVRMEEGQENLKRTGNSQK